MILAAHDVGHAHGDVVDHARQHVEPAAVGAADDRIAERRRIEPLGSADQIVPRDRRVVEAEAPVRPDAAGLDRGTRRVAELQRGAIVDRRQPAPEQHLTLEIELLRGLIGGIDAPRRAQFGKALLVQCAALGLAHLAVGGEAEPDEIVADRLREGLGRALGIGIVEAQQETPALFARIQPVVERGADVADMQPPGRRRREAGDDGHDVRNALVIGYLRSRPKLRGPSLTPGGA